MEPLSVEAVFAHYPGRSAPFYRTLYTTKLSNEQRAEFEKLPVARQMYLLHVPVRKQNRYKQQGVADYMSSTLVVKKNPNRMTEFDRAMDKRNVSEVKMKHGAERFYKQRCADIE